MDPQVSFNEKTYQRLLDASTEILDPFSGVLFGLKIGQAYIITGYYSFEHSNPKQFTNQFESANALIPLGYRIVGFFFKSPQAHLPNVIKNLCKKIFPCDSSQHRCFDFNGDSNDILISVINDKAKPELSSYWYEPNLSNVSPVLKVEVMSDDDIRAMESRFILFHIQARLPLSFHHSNNPADKKLGLEKSMSCLARTLTSDATLYRINQGSNNAFKTPSSSSSSSLLLRDGDGVKFSGFKKHFKLESSLAEPSIEKVRKSLDVNEECNHSKKSLLPYKVFNVEVLTKLTSLADADNDADYLSCIPVLYHDHMKYMVVEMELPLDVLLLHYIEDDLDDIDLSSLFADAVKKQLRIFSKCVIDSNHLSAYYVPMPHHFIPPYLKMIVTVVYPEGFIEKQLEDTRKNLHERFLIPLNTPVFKRSNRFNFSSSGSGYLLDVHHGLPPSKAGGKVGFVKGSYEYRHYMQDKIDDSGWGCAYRSLQTIASWLYLQGFTERTPPTHTQIQQALVEVGDKLPPFLGSKQWIGSTEVSYVLDHLYNVQCKISHVASGSEMISKAREIAYHFETQGSPIMIGGGVLAHTIIGIDFNESSGEVSFLILDPHYTGSEDIKVIQSKGWCGWKGPDFWKSNSFYNMCMPIKPSAF